MRHIILSDNTRIDNCSNSATAHNIVAIRDTYEEAGAVMDLFTSENSETIKVYDENDTLVETGINLKLLDNVTIMKSNDKIQIEILLHDKTEIELLQDQIAELQEAVIG